MSTPQHYVDITDILAQKARGRQERASLSFAEKLAIVDKLRRDIAPIIRARQARAWVIEQRARRPASAIDELPLGASSSKRTWRLPLVGRWLKKAI